MLPFNTEDFDNEDFALFVLTKHFLETAGNKRSFHWIKSLDMDTLELIAESAEFIVYTDPTKIRPINNSDEEDMACDFSFLALCMIANDCRLQSESPGEFKGIPVKPDGELDIPEDDMCMGMKILSIGTNCEILKRKGLLKEKPDTSETSGYLLTDHSSFEQGGDFEPPF